MKINKELDEINKEKEYMGKQEQIETLRALELSVRKYPDLIKDKGFKKFANKLLKNYK